MRLPVDTHAFLWWLADDPALPRRARSAIASPNSECLFSMASAWELAIKVSLGKLRLELPLRRFLIEQLATNGFTVLNIGIAHVGRVESLPQHHRDPFDRLLGAQGLEEGLSLVTGDPIFLRYGVRRIWR